MEPARVVDGEDYRPNQTALEFHRSRARVKGLLGGYGSGKTRAGAEEALDLAMANPGCDGIIVAPTWGVLQKVTLRAFHDWPSHTGACPRDFIVKRDADRRYLQLRNGSRVYYASSDSAGTLEGPTVAWFWVDEGRLVHPDAWRIIIGRLREQRAQRLQGVVTSTPSAGWQHEEFGSEKQDRDVFHVSTRENAHNLAAGYIEDLERTYSAREAKVLIEGQFGLLVGAVYEEFDKKTHCIPWTYNPRLRTALTIDFGYRRPAAIWLQQIPPGTPLPPEPGSPFPRVAHDNTWIAFDELMPENWTTEQLAQGIKAKGYRIDVVYCDPAGDGTQPALGFSDLDVLASYKLPTPKFVTDPRFRWVPFGVSLVAGMLRNIRGETRLYVSRDLDNPSSRRGVVKDFESYRRQEAKEGRPVSDHPVKDGLHDHGMDGVRYFAINEAVNSGTLPAHIQVL